MSEDDLAALMYMAYNRVGYGRSFASAPNRGLWKAVAAAVLRARADGRL